MASFAPIVNAVKSMLEKDPTQLELFSKRDARLGTLKLFQELNAAQRILSQDDAKSIYNTTPAITPGQEVSLSNLLSRSAFGGATRVRIGSSSETLNSVTPQFFTGIQEGLNDSAMRSIAMNRSSWALLSPETAQGVANAKLFRMFMDAVKRIYVRLDAQLSNFIVSNRWALNTTADAGNIYNAFTTNYKIVPAADQSATHGNNTLIPQFLNNIATEYERNAFDELGAPILFGDSVFMNTVVPSYAGRGASNSFNAGDRIDLFEIYGSPRLAKRVAGDTSVVYMIQKGSIAMYQQKPVDYSSGIPNFNELVDVPFKEQTPGMLSMANDGWLTMTVGAGTPFYPEYPTLELEVKTHAGHEDSSLVTGAAGIIDAGYAVSLYVKAGALRSVDFGVPAASPIIGYALA